MNKGVKISLRFDRFRFALYISGRYLFSKKSHNAINVISGISATGVAIGTMALVIVLSIFNGLETLFSDLFSNFDPDLKITLREGKIFNSNDQAFLKVKKLADVSVFTEVIEENALLKFKEKKMPATVLGVSANFSRLTHIDSILTDGQFVLYDGAFERAVPGAGIAQTLGLGAHFIDPLYIYAPRRDSEINLIRPETSFNESATFVSGVFAVQQNEFDNKYVLVSLALARDLFGYGENEVSAIEIGIRAGADPAEVQQKIESLLGTDYYVKNRYQQQESYFKIMNAEKMMAFLILAFIVLIASFNIIGSLSMLIIDKKDDILTLRNLGADISLIRLVFLLEGWMIAVLGAFIGIVTGSIISFLQEKVGLLKLGPGYIVESFPAVTQFSDILLVFLSVLLMGFLSAWYPSKYIKI